jgi:serine/threonine protein kinase
MAARYIDGVTLGQVPPERLTIDFFRALERLMNAIHARGIVHLDARGTGNLLMQPDGRPAVIDFQAALPVGWLPAAWQRRLGDIDLAGVYKKWAERDADSMGAQRQRTLARVNRWRRLWVFRGYAGARKSRRTAA